MSESNKGRRKLLKSIAAGSGAVIAGKSLPESWSKPVVDSVILPVHAQTSPCTPCNIDGLYCTGGGENSTTFNVSATGNVTITHTVQSEPEEQTDTVDPCTGESIDVIFTSFGGNDITITNGVIACDGTSITYDYSDGQTTESRTASPCI